MGAEIARYAESFQSFHYGSQKVNTYFTGLHITEIYDKVHHIGHTVLLQEVLLCLLRAADSHHDVDTTASNIGGHYQTTPHHHG
jgi:hypothetical protein